MTDQRRHDRLQRLRARQHAGRRRATGTRSMRRTTRGISSRRRRRRRPRSRTRSTISAKAQQNQIVTNRVLGSILLGATEQISCSSCGSGFGSIGSLALGAQGRWGLSDQLTAMGGVSYNQWSSGGISVYDAPTVAGSLVYDFSNLGQQPAVHRGRRRAHALRAGQLLPQLRQRLRDRARNRDGGRSRPFPVRAAGLARASHPDRRGGGLRRSRAGTGCKPAAIRRR